MMPLLVMMLVGLSRVAWWFDAKLSSGSLV